MKYFKRLFLLLFCASFLFTAPACMVVHHKDNGRHLGWYKQKKKASHPSNRGKAKGQRKGKHNGQHR